MWRTSSSAGDDVETKVIAGNQQKITGYVVKGVDGSVVITDAASGNTTRIAYNDVLKIKNFSDVEETAETFDQLQLLINPGNRISVTDRRGRVSKGKIEAISPSTIELRVKGASRNFTDADVIRITQRRGGHIGLRNGAIIGAGIGVALTVLACAYGGCTEALLGGIVVTGLSSGIGVGIGAMVDLVSRHDVTIYRSMGRISSKPF